MLGANPAFRIAMGSWQLVSLDFLGQAVVCVCCWSLTVGSSVVALAPIGAIMLISLGATSSPY